MDQEPRDGQTVDLNSAQIAQQIRDQFEADWKAVLQGGPRPSLEAALQTVPAVERISLLTQLQQIERDYQTRLAQLSAAPTATGGQTLDFASEAPARSDAAKDVSFRVAQALLNETVAPVPPSLSPTAHTIDLAPPRAVDP